MLSQSRIFIALALVAGVFLTGCGKSQPQETYRVSGELFVQNQPASGARLTLHPVQPADLKLWPMGFPRAVVERDGKFQFSCFAENDGAPAGEYKLLVTWKEGDEIPNEDPEAPPPKNRVDAKYANAETTPLTVTVEKKSTQIPRIEIP